MSRNCSLVPFILFVISTLVGCGSKHPGLVPVSGIVTIDGKPIPIGQVRLSPEGHRAAVGRIEKDGKFALTCFELYDGAPVGTHRATVTAVEQVNEQSNKWYAPLKYASEAKTELLVTIDGPTDNLKIELTWEGSEHEGPFIDRF